MTLEMDQAKSTIRKLLNLATNDGAAEGEIDNAFRFADRLMRAHHLSLDDVEENDDPHQAAANEELWEFGQAHGKATGRHFCSWEKSLASFVNQFLGSTKCYLDGHHRPKTEYGTFEFDDRGRMKCESRMIFYGLEDEVTMAAEMFDQWRLAIAALARMKCGGALRGKGQHYGDGFVAGMLEKLREGRKTEELTSDEKSTALVVRTNAIVTRKKERASSWLAHTKGIKLSTEYSSGRRTFDPNAYGQGKQDGRNADVTKPTTRKKIEQ